VISKIVDVDLPDPPEPIPGARLLFSLDPAVAHLNHGGFGGVPIGVQRAQQRLRDEMDANPVKFFMQGLTDRLAHVRRHVATFLGADPQSSALVDNVTTGIAVALNSLDLNPGDEIVTTTHVYGAVDLAVTEACRRTGAVNRVARLPLAPSDDEVVAAVRGACSPRTKLIVVDWITSATARVFPVARVAGVAREVGAAVFVDAAHAPGQLATPVARLGADFWVGNVHKWAYGARGTALLAVAPTWRERMRPIAVSWEQPSGFPASVEFGGSRDYTAWLAAPTALFTLRTLGVARVREHNERLVRFGQRVVAEAIGAPVLDQPGIAMRLVPLPDGTGPAIRQRIADQLGIEVSVNEWHGQTLLRLSAQVYNKAEEYERLAAQLPALLKGSSRT
jgi:selenocysteine lyase/cysteine desulfurase